MQYTTLYIAAAILATSCAKKQEERPPASAPVETVTAAPAKPINLLVAPGQGIGNVMLEQPADALAHLGPADVSDSAMGKSWQTWYSKVDTAATGKLELNVYTEYRNNQLKEKVVRQIRVTSPDFKTAEGVSAGMPFMEIVESYPNLKWVGTFQHPSGNGTVEVFDDAPSGIAFEIRQHAGQKTCDALIVHPKEQAVTRVYKFFRPELSEDQP